MNIIDLTLELYDGLKTFQSHPPISIKPESTFANSAQRYTAPCNGFESRMLKFPDHSGTHIDAPLHFIKEGDSVEKVSLNKVIGTAYVLDVSGFKEPDQPVTKEMLIRAESEQAITIKENDIVLVKTRKGNWGERGFFEELAFSISAGEWLVDKKVSIIGLDLPNIDINSNMKRDVHLALLSEDIYIIENLINLDELPLNREFQFIGLPLKLKNATGSPIRAVAIID